jgi:HlyD family secretion protein
MDEAPGSTRIVTILPEGSRVKADQVVAELDKSAFEDEEKNQLVRHLAAKAYVDQAKSMLEVAQISLEEFRDGIYPQDEQLIRRYIESCEIEKDRAARNLKWSRDMLALGYRTPFQVASDQAALQQTTIALEEAHGMFVRLTKYTGPKLIKALEAKVQAIQSDALTQQASYSLESQRLERIRKNIANCTVRAPGDGIVVYANSPGQRGNPPVVIDQGVTLREKQAIFNLPDPQHMRVRAKINESKVSLVHMGQPAIITVDAFPDRPLKGIVQEVTAISVPIRESDVRIYYANVDITEIPDGFDSLRPGLSAEIMVDIESRQNVTRVPIESIRWVNRRSYVALEDRSRAESGENSWRWQPIEIGLSDPDYAEVLNGLKAGDRIVSRPAGLPPPAPESVKKSPDQVADRS